MVKVREDMTGWVMKEHGVPDSKLTVIKQTEDYVDPKGRHFAKWLCECSCEDHNIIAVAGSDLKRGNTISCGCYHKEQMIERNKKYNLFSDKLCDEHGEYYIGYASNTGTEFYVDADDFDKIKNHCWYENVRTDTNTLRAFVNGEYITMHRLLGFNNYDHKDRNELNNRKYNLRVCTQQENCRNRSLMSNNTSGVTGVCWDKRANKWKAYIKTSEANCHLGSFIDINDAIVTRLKAEHKYFGDFAPQKHLFEKYGINVGDDNE
jgi:hypothetical protein